MIKIYDVFEWNQFQVISMEAGSIDLYQYIQQNYTEQEALKILQQLTYSVRFIYSNNLIHRDLKPENYIKVGDKFKLIDFGLVKQSQRLGTPNLGSPLFQAPEIVSNQQYSTPVDIWSLGCVFFEVLTKQPLCESKTEQEQLNLLKNHLNNPSHLYERIEKLVKNQFLTILLKGMIDPEPSKRVPIDEVQRQLNVVFFSNFSQKKEFQNQNNKFNNNFQQFKFQPNQMLAQQKSIEEQPSQQSSITEIKIFVTQNKELGLRLQQLLQQFEERIGKNFEGKIQYLENLQKTEKDQNQEYQSQINEQIELKIFQKLNDQFTSLQQNLFKKIEIFHDQQSDNQNKQMEYYLNNQLEIYLQKEISAIYERFTQQLNNFQEFFQNKFQFAEKGSKDIKSCEIIKGSSLKTIQLIKSIINLNKLTLIRRNQKTIIRTKTVDKVEASDFQKQPNSKLEKIHQKIKILKRLKVILLKLQHNLFKLFQKNKRKKN